MEKLLIKDLYKELHSNRIQLLKPTLKESPFYRKAFSHNSIWKNISTFLISEKHIQHKIEKYTSAIDSNKGMFWNIFYKNNPVGVISLHDWDDGNKKAEIGYWISPEFGNIGIISETIQMILSFVFKTNLLNRIEAIVYENNLASNNVITKNKFKKEALQRELLNVRGVFTNVYLYAILKKEWKEQE